MLSELQTIHDLIKADMPNGASKTKTLQTLNTALAEAKTLTDTVAGLEKQNKHLKSRVETVDLENESLRRLI